MCYYFQRPGYCYPGYGYYCYPNYSGGYPNYPWYPNYPNYPGYAYQTMTTYSYSSYSIYTSYSSYSTYSIAASPASTIMLTPTSGTTIHDVMLIITPLQGGEFAVFLSAQGLQPGGNYLIQGVVSGGHTSVVPLAAFAADNEGNGIYSHVFSLDPRIAYTGVLLLYLPNNQMEGAVLVASVTLG